MKKAEILSILGCYDCIREDEASTALVVKIEDTDIDVFVTIPYNIQELFYEARDKTGKLLLSDCFDCYETLDDYIECLMDVVDVLGSPKFRLVNDGKTLEAYGLQWYYLFGFFEVK